ncbi:uncharacterized protein LOC111790947 isoform X2 [Cucurbita pepo subsp. pepo]|uniref:uncharacterized protein LOC111790947 isoform X2 n=1 Tax=Cucurbita pepo subsp. pepo TaxID=3664 RepID=UPI000C9D4D0F|nr:uncharacterized protein LOC111790947 isoform X2 [Cucurbita pepo subsp. pepo]
MGTALLSVPAPQRAPFFHSSYATTTRLSHGPRTSLRFSSSRGVSFLSSSSSSSASVVDEETNSSPPDDLSLQSESDPDASSFRGCKACGKEEIERGCNGDGRIQGGIATVPGFGWWPIKAYRPCPEFVASGGRYKRRGQSMDEVTSGGARTEASAAAGKKDSSSKKKSAKG